MGSKASAAGLACASEEPRTELIVAEAAGSKAELYRTAEAAFLSAVGNSGARIKSVSTAAERSGLKKSRNRAQLHGGEWVLHITAWQGGRHTRVDDWRAIGGIEMDVVGGSLWC